MRKLTEINKNTSIGEAFALFLVEHRTTKGRPLSETTKRKYRSKFKLFLAEYQEQPLSCLSTELWEKWFLGLEARGYADAHLAFHRSCYRTFCQFYLPVLITNPVDGCRRYEQAPPQIVVANKEDLEAALACCDQIVQDGTPAQKRAAAVCVLASAGLRRSNIHKMRYSVVKRALQNKMPLGDVSGYLIPTGGKRDMEAVLSERKANILRAYLAIRPATKSHDRLIVVLDKRNDYYLAPLSEEGLKRDRLKICKLAGVPAFTFQETRRLVGTEVARATGSLEIAAMVLGHRSGISVVRDHYVDPDKERARLASLQAQLPKILTVGTTHLSG